MTRPFIIWTLQRTGGTNLANHLFGRSGLPGTDGVALATEGPLARVEAAWSLHEPFNMGDARRPFGPIAEAYMADKDDAALAAATATLTAARLPLKHCVEMIPWPITEALAQAAMRADYRHVMLYRRNLLDRVLSRHFAERSGIWGPELRGEGAVADAVFDEPLPIEKIVLHEKHSARRMRETWELLTAAGQTPFVVAFEDIYANPDPADAEGRLRALIAYLAMSYGAESDAAFVGEVLRWGDQGTREMYARFRNAEELRWALYGVEGMERVALPARG